MGQTCGQRRICLTTDSSEIGPWVFLAACSPKVHIKVHMQGVQVSTDDTLSRFSLSSHCDHSYRTIVHSFGSIMAQNLRTVTLTGTI